MLTIYMKLQSDEESCMHAVLRCVMMIQINPVVEADGSNPFAFVLANYSTD